MADFSRNPYLRDLSAEKLQKAEAARDAAAQILQDALEKGMYGLPVSFHYSCDEPIDSYRFCCIPTEDYLRALLKLIQKVSFKEDVTPEYAGVFAYVNVGLEPEDWNVYLCKEFWDAPDYLSKDSKAGTLIHEVSHLLGSDDITYELMEVELYENYGTLLGKSQAVQGLDEEWHYREEVAQINANSLEHEFETVLNHQGGYQNGRHTCCGEKKQHSVCKNRSTGHYHLHKHFPYRKTAMEEKLQERGWALHFKGGHPGEVRRYAKIKDSACRVSRP